MERKGRGAVVVLCLVVVAVLSTETAFTCMPSNPEPVFVIDRYPGGPPEDFQQGRLGVLLPTFGESYLYAAYRHLAGIGPSQEEPQGFPASWHAQASVTEGSAGDDGWSAARATVMGAGVNVIVERPVGPEDRWQTYWNCMPDAFQNAANTLRSRVEAFGAGHPGVRDWVRAQDQVFSNCGGGEAIPSRAKPGTPAILVADRAYQIAAAYFYAGDFEMAAMLFREIATDHASPWSRMARYLVARSLIRRGMLRQGPNRIDWLSLEQAQDGLFEILGDKRMAEMHPAAKRLLGFVRFRIDPPGRLKELSASLLGKDSGDLRAQELTDYILLLRQEGRRPRLQDRDDMTGWILTFRSVSPEALGHALKRWDETRSLPWLVAAMSKIGGRHPRAREVADAAARVGRTSPAYLTVAFHAVRLLIEQSRWDEAHTQLDRLLAPGAVPMRRSALNLFLALRMKAARNLHEYLRAAPRLAAGLTSEASVEEVDPDSAQLRPLFDYDFVSAMNTVIPLALQADAAADQSLPLHLRRNITVVAWMRALLLDDQEMVRRLAPLLERYAPEAKGLHRDYLSAPDPEARRFAAVLWLLRLPGSRPQYSGEERTLTRTWGTGQNWWCSSGRGGDDEDRPVNEESVAESFGPLASLYPKARAAVPGFLGQREIAAAQEEQKRFAAIETAPNYLSSHVLAWAKTHPKDPRNPEALHRAVWATRWGCSNEESSKYSKAAFQLLHRRYPKSEWAKQTPYWY